MGDFSGHRGQGRLPGRALFCVLLGALAFTPGCGGSDGSASAEASAATELRTDGAPRELVERCFWEGQEYVPESAMRAEFADPEEGEVRLLLSDPTVRPGQILYAAVANDSRDSVRYGTPSHVEDEDGEPVRIEGPYGFQLIGLRAGARSVGPCVSLPVPSTTPLGRHFAVLDGVALADDDTGELRAEFEVAGAAIPNPGWEVSLRRAKRGNLSDDGS